MKRVLLSVFVLASLLSVLDAAPFQTLGMLRTPDAYVLPHKAAEILLVGYYRDVARPTYVDPDMNKKIVPYGMIGVGLGDRVELGFFGGDSVYYLNAKLKLIQETLRIPQVSIGMDNILSPVNRHRAQDWTPANAADWDYADHPDKVDYEYWSPYLVTSKQMVFGGVNWMFNLGIGSNRFTGQVPRSRLFNGLFYSIELSPFKNFFIQGEYSGHDFNAGLKYNIGNFGIKVAGQAIEDLTKDNGYEDNLRLALGVSYLFDKYAKAKRRPDLRELAMIEDEIIIEEPDIDIIEPDVVVTEPEVVVTEPEVVVTEPEVVVTEPEVVVTEPEVVVTEPEVVVTEPEVVVTEPEVVVTEPDTEGGVTGEVSLGGLQFETGGDIAVEGGTYKELSPEVKDLLDELRQLREEREKAQKALLDLRKWLEEQKQKN